MRFVSAKLFFVFVLVLFTGGKMGFALAELPILFDGPNFKMADQDANELESQSLMGSVVVADFFYTSCLHECLFMTNRMQLIQKKVKDIQNIKFISISTDPKKDSSKVLKDYAKKYKIDESNWRFLRGEKSMIVDLAVKGFKLSADPKSAVHSQKFVLIDKNYKIRGYFDSESMEDVNRLIDSIRAIAK
ncbi:MAG: SCO family protein [Proteobacteria bacterium]|nr:SCO family protein [Pseudomonadota bacterium]